MVIPNRQDTLFLGHWRNDYSLLLQWLISREIRCRQNLNIMTSRDMQSHIRNRSITNNRHIRAQSTKWTWTNIPLVHPHLLGLWQMGLVIHMACVALDTLRSIYGKTTQLQNTSSLAPITGSQIDGSVIGRNHYTVMYLVGVWEGTLSGSGWHEPISS
jgi:hypothetical protein